MNPLTTIPPLDSDPIFGTKYVPGQGYLPLQSIQVVLCFANGQKRRGHWKRFGNFDRDNPQWAVWDVGCVIATDDPKYNDFVPDGQPIGWQWTMKQAA